MAAMGWQMGDVQTAIGDVCWELQVLAQAQLRWQALTEEQLWREALACILGSRVSYELATSAVEMLGIQGLLKPPNSRHDMSDYESKLAETLSRVKVPMGSAQRPRRYPFPALRASHIRRSAESIYGRGRSLKELLRCGTDAHAIRRELVRVLVGIGPKQASLFLRNIGYATELAILDSHVLRYMCLAGLTPVNTSTPQTIAQYEAREREFVRHAASMGFCPADFDIAVWVVSRVARREGYSWA